MAVMRRSGNPMAASLACALVIGVVAQPGSHAADPVRGAYGDALGVGVRPRVGRGTQKRVALRNGIQLHFDQVEAKHGPNAKLRPESPPCVQADKSKEAGKSESKWWRLFGGRSLLGLSFGKRATKKLSEPQESEGARLAPFEVGKQLLRRVRTMAGRESHTPETGIDAQIHEWLLGRAERIMGDLAADSPGTDVLRLAGDVVDQLDMYRGFVEGYGSREKMNPLQRVFEAEAKEADLQEVEALMDAEGMAEIRGETGLNATYVQRLQHLAKVHGMTLAEVTARFVELQRAAEAETRLALGIRSDYLVALTELSLRGSVDPKVLVDDFAYFDVRRRDREKQGQDGARGVVELVRLTHEPTVAEFGHAHEATRLLVVSRFDHMGRAAAKYYPIVGLDDAAVARMAELSFKYQDHPSLIELEDAEWEPVLYDFMVTRLAGGRAHLGASPTRKRLKVNEHAIADLVEYGLEQNRDPDERVTDFHLADSFLHDLGGEGTVFLRDAHHVVRVMRQADTLGLEAQQQAVLLGQIRQIDPEAWSGHLLAILSAAAAAKKTIGAQPAALSPSELAQAARLIRDADSTMSDWLYSVSSRPILEQEADARPLRN